MGAPPPRSEVGGETSARPAPNRPRTGTRTARTATAPRAVPRDDEPVTLGVLREVEEEEDRARGGGEEDEDAAVKVAVGVDEQHRGLVHRRPWTGTRPGSRPVTAAPASDRDAAPAPRGPPPLPYSARGPAWVGGRPRPCAAPPRSRRAPVVGDHLRQSGRRRTGGGPAPPRVWDGSRGAVTDPSQT